MVNDFTDEQGQQEIQLRGLAAGEMLESVASEMESRPISVDELGEDTPAGSQRSDVERNIIFVGEGEPATAYHGAFSVTLPDAETQRRGFYHPEASKIIGQFPKKYKKFVRKGEK